MELPTKTATLYFALPFLTGMAAKPVKMTLRKNLIIALN